MDNPIRERQTINTEEVDDNLLDHIFDIDSHKTTKKTGDPNDEIR